MKRIFRPAGTFAKAEGQPKTWKDRFAGLTGGKKKDKPSAKLEIDDATGETLIFPDLGDISEIVEGVTVTATDGDHVFTADNSVYTVTVLDGKVTLVIEDQTGTDDDGNPLSEETTAFVEAVVEEMDTNATFRAEALAAITTLTEGLAAANKTIATMRATMKHGGDGTDDGGDGGAGSGTPKTFKVGGKTVDISKINLNSKK